MKKLEISEVVTQDVGVIFKDDKNDYYTLKHDTFEFVKSKLNYIFPKYFIIIDIHHALISEENDEHYNLNYRKIYGYNDKILEYLKKRCVWRKRFSGIINDEHVMILKNVKTVAFGRDEKTGLDSMFMHFHNVDVINSNGEKCDFDSNVKNIEIYSFDDENNNCYANVINVLGCTMYEDMKIVVESDKIMDPYRTHQKGYSTLTLLNSNIIAAEDDPVIFRNTYGLLSGYIDSSVFHNMHILANNIHVNHSLMRYTTVNEGVPYSCIFHDRYDIVKSDAKFKVVMLDSELILADDIEFTCDIRLENVAINHFSSADKHVYSEHKINFFLPSPCENDYQYKISKTNSGSLIEGINGTIFSTYINLYDADCEYIRPHEVTVTIEDLRCDMRKYNRHLFFRAYVKYGAVKKHEIYPLDVLLRDFGKSIPSKFNRKQVKDFYKNIGNIAKLSGINMKIF